MSARTISELASWDSRKNQRNPKPHFPASHLDSYSTVPHLNRDPFTETHVNTRLPTRVDTPPAPSQDAHRQHPVPHTHAKPASQSSPLTALSSLSPLTTTSSVHASRVHVAQPSSQRRLNASLVAPSLRPEIIDLTTEDTHDELSVTDMLVPRSVNLGEQHYDPGPSRGRSASADSAPLPADRSLFTPPPRPRKHARMVIDHVAVPAFPKGLTRSDYQPLFEPSAISRDRTPITPSVEFPPTSTDESLSSAQEHATPVISSPSRKGKGKAREEDVSSSPGVPLMRRLPTASIGGGEKHDDEFWDASYTMIPLQDDDNYPLLNIQDLVVNTRFHFAHAWRGHAAKLLQAPQLEWMIKFKTLGVACADAGLARNSSPRIPGTTGWVTTEELRDWELIPLESSLKKIKKGSPRPSPSIDVDVNRFPPVSQPDDALVGPNPAFDPGLPNWNAPQEAPAMDIEMANDMAQYFNGLGDSPSKHSDLPRQQVYPTHAFRPQFLRLSGQVQMNSSGSEFPHLDPQLIEKGDNGPFFGMPPSPSAENAESSFAPRPIDDSPFESVGFLHSHSNDDFAGQAVATDNLSLHDHGGSFPQRSPSPGNQVPPIALGTIDPSLLGGEQPPASPSRSKVTTTSRIQSKLPEPIIYIRRPMNSSSLPLVSGKRPVQIKFRDQVEDDERDEDEMIPSGSKAASSSFTRNHAERSTSHAQDGLLLSKRRSVPSLKRREEHFGYESSAFSYTPSHPSESFSDFMPETSKHKPKLKPKLKHSRSSGKDREAFTESRSPEYQALPERTSCHQCRNTTLRPKMQCSNDLGGRRCARRFCNRCIMKRYPEITFDQFSAGFLCPVCTNTCNCSVCSRNRGEEFISMRERNFAETRVQARVTLVRDVGQSIPHTTSPVPLKVRNAEAGGSASARTTPTPEPGTLTAQPMFWAHVYGMEGERVGSAFISHEHVMRMQNHGLPPPPKAPARKNTQKRDKTREKAHGPRVFIGHPLKSWGIRAVRDLEPSVVLETIFGLGSANGNGKGKGKAPQRRVYIGNPTALHEPYERMPIARVASAIQTPASSRCSSPMLDSDGSLTPLSELEAEGADYWPQPDVGECCSWVPPPPPATVAVDGVTSSALLGLPSGFESAMLGSGSPGAVDSGLGSDVGMGVGVDVEVGLDLGLDMTTEVDANATAGIGADGETSAPATLSEEDMVRAITAALAALEQPS